MNYNTQTPIKQSPCSITHHADVRMRQRGITEEMIASAILIGTAFQKQGMDMIVVRKKDIPGAMSRQVAGKLIGLIILIKDGVVVTTYKRSRCAVRHLKKKNKKDMKKSHKHAA